MKNQKRQYVRRFFIAKVITPIGRTVEHKIFAQNKVDAQGIADEMFDYSKMKSFELVQNL